MTTDPRARFRQLPPRLLPTVESVSSDLDGPPVPPVFDTVINGQGLRVSYMVPSTPAARERMRWHRRLTIVGLVVGPLISISLSVLSR